MKIHTLVAPTPIEEGYEIISVVFYRKNVRDLEPWYLSLIADVIRWRTKSIYPHVGLYIDGVIYEAATDFKGVKASPTRLIDESWTTFHIAVTKEEKAVILEAFAGMEGLGYDFVNIFFVQLLGLFIDRPENYICSELVAKLLDVSNIIIAAREYKYYSPGNLYDHVLAYLGAYYHYNYERNYFIRR